MLDFIQSQFLFYFAIILVLFVPGYSLLYAFFGKKWPFPKLEAFFISCGVSIVVVDFIMLLMGRLGVNLNKLNLFLFIIFFSFFCVLFFLWKRFKNKKDLPFDFYLPKFSKPQFIALIILIFLTFFVKTIYLQNTILPTSTDLGHHMYWAKEISITEKIPEYAKININKETNTLTKPEPIDDFIVGEHLIFSAINIISGIDFISYFPSLILFLIHLMGILAIFSLSRLLFIKNPNVNAISLATLFFTGPLYALASPQVKFASGGVVGNLIGNFFIPLAIYLFLYALTEKNSKILAMAFFILLGMIYTHHLSTLVFIFIFIFSGLFFVFFNIKEVKKNFQDWIFLIFKPAPLIVLFLGVSFVFFIYMPTYFDIKAIDTAVGTPSKATREGFSFSDLSYAVGKVRMALGIFGIAFLLFSKKRKTYASAFILGWAISIISIASKPNLFYVDIPSNRIADYVVFPLSILSGFAFVYFFNLLKNVKENKQYHNPNFILITFLLLFTFLSISGLRENASALSAKTDIGATLETYHVSNFLAQKTSDEDIILKDHNYVATDSWMKLYFMRDYAYPLSRGYFKRYEDITKDREQCTNLMISVPSDPEAKKCFAGTKTNFLVVNPKFDLMQFAKSKDFWKVYTADNVVVFYKNN